MLRKNRNCYDFSKLLCNITKNDLNSMFFLIDLSIFFFFKRVHKILYMNYMLVFDTIFRKCILFQDPRYPIGTTKT